MTMQLVGFFNEADPLFTAWLASSPLSGLVPYTGASSNVALGAKSLSATGLTDASLTASRPVAADADKKLIVAPTQSGWSTTNVTTTRTFDANNTSLDIIADVLGTLLADLKAGKWPVA